MNIVDKAEEVALKAHFAQANKHDQEPYVLHLQRVYIACRESGLDVVHQSIAWLHDTIEDTELTLSDLVYLFPGYSGITTNVQWLTKRSGQSNEEYYMLLQQHPIAARVKLRDIDDNFGRNHLIEDEDTRLRMAKKYSLGIDLLKGFR